MDKIAELDATFDVFIDHVNELVPEGLMVVDLPFLQGYDLLAEEAFPKSPTLTRFFHVVESKEKITLFNDQFVVWIVPERGQEEPTTMVLIAVKNSERQPDTRLETGFVTVGIYNTSKLVLRIIEKVLADIQENEEVLSHLVELDAETEPQ